MTKKYKAQLNKTLKAVEEIDMLGQFKALTVALQKEISHLQSELENIQHRINQRGGFVEIDDARAKAALYDSLKSDKEDLEDDKETLYAEIENLKSENDDLKDKNRDLEAELDDREETGRSHGYDDGYSVGYEAGYEEGREAEADQNRMGA